MDRYDLILLLPELTLVGLAGLVILVDLVARDRRIVTIVAIGGLVVPLAMIILLWVSLSSVASGQALGVFDTLVVDRFALFFKFLVLGAAAMVLLASTDYVSKFQRFQGEYYALILFSATGMMLLAATRDLIAIYVALELTSLPLAALAAFLRDTRSTEAGIKFLLLSALSSAILLYGMALVFGFTGATNLADIAQAVANPAQPNVPFGSYALLLGIVLMVAGFGFKISSVPFQMWVPDVYEGAPTPVTAYLSVASKAAGFAVLLRVFYTAFQSLSVDWAMLFAVLSGISMTLGNLVAVAQNNIKRMLAYSTIAHAGYIMVGLAAIAARSPNQTTLGPSGVLFYLGAYTVTNLAAFFAVIAISNKVGSEAIDDYAGMGSRAPVLAAVLALSMVSLIGLPPTAGFIAKLYVFNAAVGTNMVWLVVAGVINSVISAYYYLRVIKVMYLSPAASREAVPSSGPFRLALGVCGLGVLVLGIIPGPLMRVAESAVRVLFS